MCVVLLFCCGKSAGWKLLTQPALLPLRILGCIVVYCMSVHRTVLLSVVFYFNVFLFAVNFVIFSLRATILINLNLNLNLSTGLENPGFYRHVPTKLMPIYESATGNYVPVLYPFRAEYCYITVPLCPAVAGRSAIMTRYKNCMHLGWLVGWFLGLMSPHCVIAKMISDNSYLLAVVNCLFVL